MLPLEANLELSLLFSLASEISPSLAAGGARWRSCWLELQKGAAHACQAAWHAQPKLHVWDLEAAAEVTILDRP